MRQKLKSRAFAIGLVSLTVTLFTLLGFQNCARAKYTEWAGPSNDAFLASCDPCSDQRGTGFRCPSLEGDEGQRCRYDSCAPGFELGGNFTCNKAACTPGSFASCPIANGEGRMSCHENGEYGECHAISCSDGYVMSGGACVPGMSGCEPNSQLSCDTDSFYGTKTCRADGTGWQGCVISQCKPGHHLEDGQCVTNLCEPNTVTPCTSDAGSGMQACNSDGQSWGSCILNDCEPGYSLVGGVCVVQQCTPGSSTMCEIPNASGMKQCTPDGMNYGPCTLVECDEGFTLVNGICKAQVCTPGNQIVCRVPGGQGHRTCNAAGLGYGGCQADTCHPPFKMKNGRCVYDFSCWSGQKHLCTNFTGLGWRTCSDGGRRLGPCVPFDCRIGYDLITPATGNAYCKWQYEPIFR